MMYISITISCFCMPHMCFDNVFLVQLFSCTLSQKLATILFLEYWLLRNVGYVLGDKNTPISQNRISHVALLYVHMQMDAVLFSS